MELDKYEIQNSVNSMYFEFLSSGINGNIVKVVKYTPFPFERDAYNLGFGDKNLITGELDDAAVTNNGDTDKVLSTVAFTLYEFFEEFPASIVYSTGVTDSRTRLYK